MRCALKLENIQVELTLILVFVSSSTREMTVHAGLLWMSLHSSESEFRISKADLNAVKKLLLMKMRFTAQFRKVEISDECMLI